VRTLIISANERKPVKAAFSKRFDLLEMNLPFDLLLYTKTGPIALERKVFPSDFIASVQDGRFSREIAEMHEQSQLCFIICEGKPRWREGHLISGGRVCHWNKTAIWNIKRSLRYQEGCDILETDNLTDTVEQVVELADYFDTEKHRSLHNRTGVKSNWPKATDEERYLHWLQGLPECRIGRAKLLAGRYKTPDELFSASIKDINSIKGMGHYMSGRIWNFLHGGEKDV
jgi:ERCC4-type nuclease